MDPAIIILSNVMACIFLASPRPPPPQVDAKGKAKGSAEQGTEGGVATLVWVVGGAAALLLVLCLAVFYPVWRCMMRDVRKPGLHARTLLPPNSGREAHGHA